MDLSRQMSVVGGPQSATPRLSVAFASSDGRVVDAHFGYAASMFVYSVTKTTAHVCRIGEFATKDESQRGRLTAKLVWLGSCHVVYSAAIGSSASAQLMARGVLPLRAGPGTPISELIDVIQEELDAGVAQWLSRVTRFKWQTVRAHQTVLGLKEQEE
jgi:nitrogen fixation protein NifX